MKESEIKRMSVYDFYFRIFTFKKRAMKQKPSRNVPSSQDW